MVDLKYGEVCSIKSFSLFIDENVFGSVSKLSFDLVNDEISSFIHRVTFSFNFSLLIRVLAPDTYFTLLVLYDNQNIL